MDNRDIAACARIDSKYLNKTYAGCVTEDDINSKILPSLENFRQFLVTSLLQRDIPSFPFGYILNTGTHANGGRHWQAVYFDHEHRAYFFDSYGRKPAPIFKKFADSMLVFSYLITHVPKEKRQMDLKDILSVDYFTFHNLRIANYEKNLRDRSITSLYFSYQIQSDYSNVCGEYSVLFLYYICRYRSPATEGYNFWYNNNFFLYNHNDKLKKKKSINDAFIRNDTRISKHFFLLFNYKDKNILS